MKQVRFDTIFDEQFLSLLYIKFEQYLNDRVDKQRFKVILVTEVLVGVIEIEMRKVIADYDLRVGKDGIPMTMSDLADFLVAHCFNVCFALMRIRKHTFSKNEKLAVAAYSMWLDDAEENETIEDVIDLYLSSGFPEAFIESSFKWTIEGITKEYTDEMALDKG